MEELSREPHEHIMCFLAAWVASDASYMLFPLADGDLHHFLAQTPPPPVPSDVLNWLLSQMIGICDAIRYVHEHVSSDDQGRPTRRIGFHHDLKPANILLFRSDRADRAVWKLGDFGSGATMFVDPGSQEELYNRKASTGDPVYSAPEYVVLGKVSRPKDVWGLGCIFLEVLIWALTPEAGAIERFEKARGKYSRDNPDNAPVYWCQDSEGRPYINLAVVEHIQSLQLQTRTDSGACFQSVLSITETMLAINAEERPTAARLCERFKDIQQ